MGGSVQCSFPWHAYYTFFHARHHAYTGSNNDKDGVILFSSWYRPWRWLQGSIMGRWLWTAIFAVGIFGFYLENKLAELREDCKVLPPKYAEQLRRSTFLGLCQLLSIQVVGWLVAHSLVFWYGGLAGCSYMWASAAFANGAFGHPYLGFWIIQHQCCNVNDKKYQPTVSYTGSPLWHLLNLGELHHIQHHDFPTVPWTKLYQIHRIAPEFYSPPLIQKSCKSITGEIRKFLAAKSNDEWLRDNGDFGSLTL